VDTCTTTTSNSTSDWNYAKLMETMNKVKDEMAKNPLAKIDYIVASKQGLDIVIKTIGSSDIEQPNWLDARLFGIPVLCYEVEREARTKALELCVIENKKVIFIDDTAGSLNSIWLRSRQLPVPEGVYFGSLGYPWNGVPTRASNNR